MIFQLNKMCDHNDVDQLKVQMIQAQDGFKRYTCKTCKETVKKDVYEDAEFNRLYQRHHNLCVRNHLDIPTYKDSVGNTCCMWCGIEIK
jgi:hypothetical protein